MGTLIAVFIVFRRRILEMTGEALRMVKDIFTGKFSFRELTAGGRGVVMIIVSLLMLLPFYIFRDVFDDDTLVIEDSTNSSDIEDWDSLEHIALIVSMEKEFDLKFDLQEVNKLANVGEMVDLIESMM